MQPQPLSAERLEHLLAERGEMSQRARQTPREVFAKWLDNFGVGLGAGVGVGVLLWLLRAPDNVLLSVAPGLGLLVFAAMMAWRGSLDERSDWRNTRSVRRTVTALRSQYEVQARTLRGQLEAAFDEIESLERALDRMTQERDVAIYEVGQARKAAQGNRNPYVPAIAPTPRDVADATEMIRYRYQLGEHLSRRKAGPPEEGGVKSWSQPRWEAAMALLQNAGVITMPKGQARYPQTLDEALQVFGAYLLRADKLSAPAINAALGVSLYVEPENDE